MSELNSTIDFLEGSEIQNPPTDSFVISEEKNKTDSSKLFDIQEFGQELYQKSEKKNRQRALRPHQNITGYLTPSKVVKLVEKHYPC